MPPSSASYTETYYTASTALPEPFPALAGTVTADVCVVGGGIAGCSAALELAQRGYRVALLEAQRVGWGASGRGGGQAIHGLAIDQEKLESLVGATDARRLWDISLAGLALLRQRIRQHRIDCDWVDGQLYAALKARHWLALQRWHAELAGPYGYRSTRLMGPEELRSVLASTRYLGGLYDSNGGHLHPLRYTLGLATAAAHAGASIHEASRATAYRVSARGLTVSCPGGEVHCRSLLLAGNAWLGSVAPALSRTLLSISSSMVATEPLGERRARELIANNAAVCDTNWVLDYFRRTRDDRLLFGGRVSYSGIDVRAIAPATQRRLLRVFPQLAGTRIDYAWGCRLDITANRAPHFGRLAPDVYFLQGFSGHGLALAGIAGALVAEAIAGTAERFDLFARLTHRDFPGGPLRRPLLALAMLWYRLRDLL